MSIEAGNYVTTIADAQHGITANKPYLVDSVDNQGYLRFKDDDGESRMRYGKLYKVVPAPLPSPTCTRTVTEIVPGVYAGFHIGANDAGKVHVVQGDKEMFSAPELRAAAAVLTQLADALETE